MLLDPNGRPVRFTDVAGLLVASEPPESSPGPLAGMNPRPLLRELDIGDGRPLLVPVWWPGKFDTAVIP